MLLDLASAKKTKNMFEKQIMTNEYRKYFHCNNHQKTIKKTEIQYIFNSYPILINQQELF